MLSFKNVQRMAFAALTAFSASSWSQMSDSGSQPNQKIARLEMRGQEAHFVFFDGREASLFIKLGKKTVAPIGLNQIENTCRPQQPPARCRIEIEAIPVEVSVRWTKNPDSQKIGKIVKINDKFITNENRTLFRHLSPTELYRHFSGERIICDDLAWLSEAQEVRERIHLIQSWSGEFMLENEETGISENQAISAQYHVELERVDQKQAHLINYGYQAGINFSSTFLLSPITNLVFKNKTGSICQTSFQVDTSKAQQMISEVNGTDLEGTPAVPLTIGLQLSSLAMDLYSLFQERYSNLVIQ